MNTYILAFADEHDLDEVRVGVQQAAEDVPSVVVERVWEQEGDPGEYVVLRAPHSDEIRGAFSEIKLRVEGLVELASLPDADDPFEMLRVYREHLLNDAFIDSLDEPHVWCDECDLSHKRGRHVRH